MSSKRISVNRPKNKDDHYEKIIQRMERDIEKLKAKNKMLTEAAETTETYLLAITKDKTIQEIFQEVLDNTKTNIEGRCPKCGSEGMKKINLGHIKVISCSCGYRNRVNEQGSF